MNSLRLLGQVEIKGWKTVKRLPKPSRRRKMANSTLQLRRNVKDWILKRCSQCFLVSHNQSMANMRDNKCLILKRRCSPLKSQRE
jgi:heterodisulfide reductase subunit B